MVSVVELVDTPDCGSGAAALRVQVSSLTPEIWKSGRVADGTILERWRTERFRGFESHFFLHQGNIAGDRAYWIHISVARPDLAPVYRELV